LKVLVQVRDKEFTTLIDSGSTHNFFSTQVAQAVELQFQENIGTTVVVANGDHVPCSGLAKDIEIKVGDDIFTINAYSIPLDSFDMVLGVSFLKPLHTIQLYSDDLVMSFTYNGKRVWKVLGVISHQLPTYIPSSNKNNKSSNSFCTLLKTCSRNPVAYPHLVLVTTESTSSPIPSLLMCTPTGPLNYRKMNLKPSASRCYSKAPFGQVLLLSLPQYC
jgi:hypothetical protein